RSNRRRSWATSRQGALGDAMHAVLCGAGHNLRMILRKLKVFYALIPAALLAPLVQIMSGA
ncbi:MAG: Mobile element protein, partial [uncultured Paraburkholderia sp.]